MQFTETLECRSNPDEVWRRMCNVEEIPQYWHGTKAIQIIAKNAGASDVRVQFAFGGTGKAEITVDDTNRLVTIRYYSGPFIGSQKIVLEGQKLTAAWDVKFTGAFRLLSKWNERHFRTGTVHALERLCTDVNY